MRDKVAVITGASRGIGAATARLLAGAGVRLGLGSRSGDDLGLDDVVARRCDVREPAQVQALVDATVDRFGRLDILVANAGVGSYHALLDTPSEHIEEMIDVNLKGTIYSVRAALPHLLAAEQSDIVAIASEAGRRAAPGQAVYCASKFGQVGFMRALDHELRGRGIRCTSVCPGGVATDFALADGYGRKPEVLDAMMRPEDVAEVVLFVLTRPRNLRLLEATLRPMTEASWG